MKQYVDLNGLKDDLIALLEKNKLRPETLALGLVLSADQFDAIAADHPDQVRPELIQKSNTESQIRWSIAIQREKNLV